MTLAPQKQPNHPTNPDEIVEFECSRCHRKTSATLASISTEYFRHRYADLATDEWLSRLQYSCGIVEPGRGSCFGLLLPKRPVKDAIATKLDEIAAAIAALTPASVARAARLEQALVQIAYPHDGVTREDLRKAALAALEDNDGLRAADAPSPSTGGGL